MYTKIFTSVIYYLWICKGLHEYARVSVGVQQYLRVNKVNKKLVRSRQQILPDKFGHSHNMLATKCTGMYWEDSEENH